MQYGLDGPSSRISAIGDVRAHIMPRVDVFPGEMADSQSEFVRKDTMTFSQFTRLLEENQIPSGLLTEMKCVAACQGQCLSLTDGTRNSAPLRLFLHCQNLVPPKKDPENDESGSKDEPLDSFDNSGAWSVRNAEFRLVWHLEMSPKTTGIIAATLTRLIFLRDSLTHPPVPLAVELMPALEIGDTVEVRSALRAAIQIGVALDITAAFAAGTAQAVGFGPAAKIAARAIFG